MGSLGAWMLLHLVLAAGGTWLARHYALRRRLLDQPGERRSHSVATPRGGGISIVVVMLLGCAWLLLPLLQWPGHGLVLGCFAIGLALVAGIGWVDDHRPLSPWLRLVVQALAAAVFAWAIQRTTGGLMLGWATFTLVMVLVNVWNFMDGIDGLAASQAGIAAGGFAMLLAGPWGWLAAGLVAAVGGFLPFNFPRARIFLGDVGSGALGYLVAGLLVAALVAGEAAWPLLLLPISAFVVDAGFTLAMRILRRERWWAPHVQHAYQGWARRSGGGHMTVTLSYAGFSLMAVLLMLVATHWPLQYGFWACLAWYGFAIVVWARLRRYAD